MHDINETRDVAKETPGNDVPLSPAGQRAMPGGDQPAPITPETPPADQSDGFHAQSASTEFGDAMRVETGVERSEVRNFNDIVPEGIYGEGRGGRG